MRLDYRYDDLYLHRALLILWTDQIHLVKLNYHTIDIIWFKWFLTNQPQPLFGRFLEGF